MCRRAAPPFQRAIAYGAYDGTLRDLIHLLKYQRVRPVAALLGGLLAEALTAVQLPPSLLVAPVPLYKRKLRERGFNQAEEIARAWRSSPKRGRHPIRSIFSGSGAGDCFTNGVDAASAAGQPAGSIFRDESATNCRKERSSSGRCNDHRNHGRRMCAGASASGGQAGFRSHRGAGDQGSGNPFAGATGSGGGRARLVSFERNLKGHARHGTTR